MFDIPISDVVDLLGLERNPRDRSKSGDFTVKCPFCDGQSKKYHMHVNPIKNVYFCPRCMDSNTKNTGALDLYGRVRFGTPIHPGVNGKELYHKLCLELESNDTFDRSSCVYSTLTESAPEDIFPANNQILDKAYRALLSLPYLSLSDEHIENLKARGLDEKSIEEGKYASLRNADVTIKNHPSKGEILKWYEESHISKIRAASEILKSCSKTALIAGLLIAKDLSEQGISLERIPGFFLVKERWCFRYIPGMLIPTQNFEGMIVGLQVRKDTKSKDGLRYLTISSKGFECGVSTGIARTHIVGVGALDDQTAVFITEGPLKANIILQQLKRSYNGAIFVVAVQGVSNTAELPHIAKILKDHGIHSAYSALDMDKCTNIYVARAGKAMKCIFAEHGIKLKSLCWDREYANNKRVELKKICTLHDRPTHESDNVFEDIFDMSLDLFEHDIAYDVYEANGKPYTCHWRDETKGLDDYLNYNTKGQPYIQQIINQIPTAGS